MSLANRLFKNTGYLVIGDVLSSLLQFVFILYLGKAFGEAGVGKYSFAFSFVMVFVVFADLGIGTYLIREVSRDKEDRTIVTRALLARLIAMAIFGLLLFSAVFILRNKFSVDKIILIALMGLYQVFFGMADILLAEFKGHERMEYVAILGFFLKVMVVGMGLALISMGYSLITVIVVLPVGAFTYLALTGAFSIYSFGVLPLRGIEGHRLVSLLRDILPFGITIVLVELLGRQEILILSFLKGDEAAGIYTIGLKIATFILGFSILIQVSVLPTLSNYFITSHERLVEVSSRLVRYLLIAGIPISTGFYFLADKIIRLLYKDLFQESIVVLKITGWLVAIGLVQALFSVLLTAINRQGLKAFTVGIALLLSVVLNLLLVSRFSYVGAAIVRVAVETIPLLFYVYFVYKYLAYVPLLEYAIRPLIASAIMALSIYWVQGLNLFLIIPIGAVVYLISLLTIGGLRQEDFKTIRGLVLRNDKAEAI